MSKPFSFKQFTISQKISAFKVGTDSVLLGAWTDPGNPSAILDIGCGTGVLSLMMAQRTNGIIDGVEIDPLSAEEAYKNVSNSKWAHRISIHNTDILSFTPPHAEKYDLIISNPPYFENNLKNENIRKSTARHTDSLTYEKLAGFVNKYLHENGTFCFILPAEGFDKLAAILELSGYTAVRTASVSSFESGSIIRKIGEFKKGTHTTVQEHIFLYKNEQRERSEKYAMLTQEFYL